ncbi:MAG TPA: host-nuclease inhibitor Gam family protein [Candidatus Saccharimonadales bacterium]|nr:host-nuclease inhibitor Gam family protein [Candidatus Saccharimonadales bacterium]
MGANAAPALPAHPNVPPGEITQANNNLGELRRIYAAVARRQAELDATVATLVAAAQADIQADIEAIPALEADLELFADDYRDELAKGRGETKTIRLPNGELVFKPTTLSVSIDDEDKALADIARRGWSERFTEPKRIIVKDRLKDDDDALRDARKIKGITVNDPEEQFQIKPAAIKLKSDTKLKTEPPETDGIDS